MEKKDLQNLIEITKKEEKQTFKIIDLFENPNDLEYFAKHNIHTITYLPRLFPPIYEEQQLNPDIFDSNIVSEKKDVNLCSKINKYWVQEEERYSIDINKTNALRTKLHECLSTHLKHLDLKMKTLQLNIENNQQEYLECFIYVSEPFL